MGLFGGCLGYGAPELYTPRRPHCAALKDWTKLLHTPGSQFSHW